MIEPPRWPLLCAALCAAAEDKENQMACQEARHRAESLADKPRSYRTESDGTRVIQTDEDHQASIAKMRAWIAEHCQP
ncbi:MAG: hypothetical protein M3461_17035 [Pseudomonadota bacterium]|nr:hypothetical protein [Pseudomonadota bacterium]